MMKLEKLLAWMKKIQHVLFGMEIVYICMFTLCFDMYECSYWCYKLILFFVVLFIAIEVLSCIVVSTKSTFKVVTLWCLLLHLKGWDDSYKHMTIPEAWMMKLEKLLAWMKKIQHVLFGMEIVYICMFTLCFDMYECYKLYIHENNCDFALRT